MKGRALLPLFAGYLLFISTAVQGTQFTTGVFYYPWYSSDFHGGNYLREHLVPPQLPVLGEYNDRDAAVIKQHADWSRYAGVQVWAASWWGPGSREDNTLLNHTFQIPDLGDIKVAILYETVGRTSDFTDYSRIASDFTYLAENYFNHPNYFTIGGRPVVVVYLTRVLSSLGTLTSTASSMRAAASSRGFDVFIIGDQVFGSPPGSAGDMTALDAVTEYDVYGSIGLGGYAGQAGVDAYGARQEGWKALATGAGVGFVPAATPGFNDKGVRSGHPALSRRLTAVSEPGSLFRSILRSARGRADPSVGNLLFVTSWNEWHEDTEVEPVQTAPGTTQDDSISGSDYTTGLEYEGSGTLYLDILREELRNSSVDSWQLYTEQD
jgi:hypothetical protein